MKEMDEIYKRYAMTVYRYLLSLSHDPDLAEELTQETFCQAISSVGRFEGRSKVSTWLCGIAKRVYLKYVGKHPEHEELSETAASGNSAEDSVIADEAHRELLKKLHGLKEPEREIMYLRLFGDLSFREIGDIVGVSENSARVTYFRTRERLRKEREKDE